MATHDGKIDKFENETKCHFLSHKLKKTFVVRLLSMTFFYLKVPLEVFSIFFFCIANEIDIMKHETFV